MNGNKVEVRDQDRLRSSVHVPNTDPAFWLRDAATMCRSTALPDEKFAGEETVSGYRAAKIVLGTFTAWYALDQGCARVHERAEFPDGKSAEKSVLSLTLGEPDPALFEVLTDYVEVAPSVFHAGALKSRPELAASQDKIYREHRPQ